MAMHNLFAAISIGLAVLTQVTPAAAQPEISAPFPEEAAILQRIEKGPSPLLEAELAGVRARHAATCYERWQASGKSVDLQQAIFYAASAAELSPQWDRPRVLLGMIYASFQGDPEALELAAEVLVEAIDINPANGPAQLLLAQVLMNQGRFWSAIPGWTRC